MGSAVLGPGRSIALRFRSHIVAASVMCVVVLVAASAKAAEVLQQITNNEAAALLIQADRLDDAKRVLALSLQQNPNDYEAIFMIGLIAVAEQRYDEAIASFRQILAAEPERERVRLELARAFFLQGDYDNAERNFRFARAGDLPDEVRVNIDQYIAVIQRVKRWSYDVLFALADDTNVNGATTAQQVDIYGLPFTLSDDARQTSGVGIMFDVGGDWSPLLSQNIKARIGARVRRLEYGGGDFDDMTVSVYAGPSLLFQRWQIDVIATGFQRWYGNTPYNQGIGGRGAVLHALTPRIQIGLGLNGQSVIYKTAAGYDGAVTSADFQIGYTITPSSVVRFTAGIGEQRAELKALANTSHWLAVNYYRDLPLGFSAGLEPAILWTTYNAPLAAFGVTRSDSTWAIRLDLLNRRLEYRGFAPRLSFIYVNQSSNIELYRYSRSQIQLGLTRQF
jgi:tetratricopeptide (TPR) repeat protein